MVVPAESNKYCHCRRTQSAPLPTIAASFAGQSPPGRHIEEGGKYQHFYFEVDGAFFKQRYDRHLAVGRVLMK